MSTCGERGSPVPKVKVDGGHSQPSNIVVKEKKKKKSGKKEVYNGRKAKNQAWLARRNAVPPEARAAEAAWNAELRAKWEVRDKWLKTEAGKRHTENMRRANKLKRIIHLNSCWGFSKSHCTANGCSEAGKIDAKHWVQCRIKDNKCQYPGCVDARNILKHYHHCWHRRNVNCEVCGWKIRIRMSMNPTLRRDPIPDAA